MRKMGGIGMVMLVVVLAIVLLLVARSWQALAPTAIDVTNPDPAGILDDHGDPEAGAAVRSGRLPDLHEMRERTAEHAEQVEDALEKID